MVKDKKVAFAPGTKSALPKVVTSKAQIVKLKAAVSELQTKSIKSLMWNGRVSTLKSGLGQKDKLYVYRVDKANRIVFSDNKDGVYVHDVVDLANRRSLSGKAFKIKEES